MRSRRQISSRPIPRPQRQPNVHRHRQPRRSTHTNNPKIRRNHPRNHRQRHERPNRTHQTDTPKRQRNRRLPRRHPRTLRRLRTSPTNLRQHNLTQKTQKEEPEDPHKTRPHNKPSRSRNNCRTRAIKRHTCIAAIRQHPYHVAGHVRRLVLRAHHYRPNTSPQLGCTPGYYFVVPEKALKVFKHYHR